MRTFILFALSIAALAAADVETFHLKDGRTITGVYDEAKQVVSVKSGKLTADLPLKKWDIKSREPFVAPPKPESQVPPVPPTAESEPIEKEKTENIKDIKKKLAECAQAYERGNNRDLVEASVKNYEASLKKYDAAIGVDFTKAERLAKDAAEMQKLADSEYVAAFRAWFKAGNYKPSNRPVSKDPRESEVKMKQRENQFNQELRVINDMIWLHNFDADSARSFRNKERVIGLFAEFSEP